MANSASCGNGPLESNGDSNLENSVEGITSGQRSNHIEFLNSFDGDASTFASYFVFLMKPHVLTEESSCEPTPLSYAPSARGDRGHSATS